MNILSIGSDRKVFEPHSRVRDRLLAYGNRVDHYHVVVMCPRTIQYTDAERHPSTQVTLYPTYSHSRFLYPLDALRVSVRVLRDVRQKADGWVLTAQDPFESGLCALFLSRRFQIPFQVQLHTDPFSAQFLSVSWLNRVRMYIASWVVPRATRVRVVSEALQKQVHTRYAVPLDRIDVLPIFVGVPDASVDTSERRQIADHHPKVVLMVGRLAPEKDFETALGVFGEVLETHPNTQLVLVGDGPLRPQLEKITSNEKYAGKVLFQGWQQNVWPYYRNADVFLFTSRYEGYGMVLIEAALSGCAIVSTNVGIAEEYFGATSAARVCAVGDRQCLSSQLRDLLTHDTERISLGAKAKSIAIASYASTLEEYAEKQIHLLSKLLERP